MGVNSRGPFLCWEATFQMQINDPAYEPLYRHLAKFSLVVATILISRCASPRFVTRRYGSARIPPLPPFAHRQSSPISGASRLQAVAQSSIDRKRTRLNSSHANISY